MQQLKFKRFWHKVIRQRKLIRFLLLPIGIIGVPVIMLIVPLSYTLDTSVPFPYIPPPEGPEGYYIQITPMAISTNFTAAYVSPFAVEHYTGQSFIFKNVLITTTAIKTRRVETYVQSGELEGRETETYLMVSLAKFVPRDPSDLKKLKAGDMVDIIGICAGMSKEWRAVVVVKNCQFLPAGLVPLPLPGGPAPMFGRY